MQNTQNNVLVSLREKTGLDITAFAAFINIPYQTYYKWEKGYSDPPTYIQNYIRLVSYFKSGEKPAPTKWRWAIIARPPSAEYSARSYSDNNEALLAGEKDLRGRPGWADTGLWVLDRESATAYLVARAPTLVIEAEDPEHRRRDRMAA